MGICSVEGCNRIATKKGMCNTHYNRVWIHGTIEKQPRKPREIKYCSIEGCNKKHHQHGFCGMHYMRFKRHGDPLIVNKHGRKAGGKNQEKEKVICSVENCCRMASVKGLCKKHYNTQWVKERRKMAKKSKIEIKYHCEKCGFIPAGEQKGEWLIIQLTCPNCGERLKQEIKEVD